MEISGRIRFDARDAIYREHFPGYPVVPGSVVIQGFLEALKQAGISLDKIRIKRFRFIRFIHPGEYRYRMRVQAESLSCMLLDRDTVVSKGRLVR